MSEPLLKVKDLKKYFDVRGGVLSRVIDHVHAVDGVSLEVAQGETLGVVGESGCGKSTTGRCILRLIEPTSGEIWFQGEDVRKMDGERLRALRRDMQIIFQDPYASLNPRLTVGGIIGEALQIHNLAKNNREIEARVVDLLETVGLRSEYMHRYPHEFSGGQRQRIGIARALAVEPADRLRRAGFGARRVGPGAGDQPARRTCRRSSASPTLFIAHDLSVVEHISDRVAVMYLGRVVEVASAKDLYANPRHPYTEALLSAVPIPDPKAKRKRIVLQGDVPNPIRPPSGCHFHTRCPIAVESCSKDVPHLKESAPGHWVSCHLRS